MKNLVLLLFLLLASCIELGDGVSLGEPVSVEVFLKGGPVAPINEKPASVAVFAGSTYGFIDEVGTGAKFRSPAGIEVDSEGNIYVADYENHRIRKITPEGSVSTLAGSGTAGFADGDSTNAQFNGPTGVTVDTNGNVYVADTNNYRIRKITPSGMVTTLAGSGTQGSVNGQGVKAQFNSIRGVAAGPNGNVYVADFADQRIRKITPSGTVSTLAGSGTAGSLNGQGTDAEFFSPYGIAVGSDGNIYVADYGNYRIRKITPSGMVSTLAGSGVAGTSDGEETTAEFKGPYSITVSSDGYVYVADTDGDSLRKISSGGRVSTIAQNLNHPEDIGLTSDGLTGYVTTDDHQIIRVRLRQ